MSGFICSFKLLATLFTSCAAPAPFATGYVEGEYVLIAPAEQVQIDGIAVKRGDHIAAGDTLVLLQKRDAELALAEANAALAKASSQLADLKEGSRPEEIAVIEASLASARAQADEAQRTADRYAGLAERGAMTDAQSEDAATAAAVARAKVAEVEANLVAARLPARPQAILAAEAAVNVATAARDAASWSLEQRELTAPTAGTVFDVTRSVGEIAGPSAPVLTLLPDDAVKLRLYVPETSIAQVTIGTLLDVNCDGCADGLTAQVIYVSDSPEFTPPVIYSLENRQKLVYLIEATPQTGDLKPGQIVDVALPTVAE